jgi:hypothetical protein|tara:strand:- start:290 stop:523 length:234 start_codon:yes stop_codon:yes gene_type:complete
MMKGIDMTSVDCDGRLWMLVDSDGNPVSRGDNITDNRGEVSVLDSAEMPRHSASTGRVNNYFPSVFSLEWKEVYHAK